MAGRAWDKLGVGAHVCLLGVVYRFRYALRNEGLLKDAMKGEAQPLYKPTNAR